MGLAIPVDKVVRVVPVLIQKGRFPHPWLGFEEMGYEITSGLAQALNLPVQNGLLIAQFYRGSPAEQAGVRGAQNETIVGNRRYLVGGDILCAIEGVPLKKWDDLNAYLEEKAAVGQEVTLTVVRSGKEQTLKAKLADTPESVRGYSKLGAAGGHALTSYSADPFCWLRGSRRTGTASSPVDRPCPIAACSSDSDTQSRSHVGRDRFQLFDLVCVIGQAHPGAGRDQNRLIVEHQACFLDAIRRTHRPLQPDWACAVPRDLVSSELRPKALTSTIVKIMPPSRKSSDSIAIPKVASDTQCGDLLPLHGR